MSLVLGIDPGPVHSGCALVDLSGPRPYLVEYGYLTFADVRAWLAEVAADVVAVEVPDVAHGRDPNMSRAAIYSLGTNLTRTGKIAVDFARDADARGIRSYRLTAQAWRRNVPHGRGGCGDKAVKAWLLATVDGMVRTSNHVRDAIGVGIVGGAWARMDPGWAKKSAGAIVLRSGT